MTTGPISTEGPTTVTVRARGDLVVWDIGRGPAVLVVHGFPDHPRGLLDFAQRLSARGYRCLLPALPGYWPSSPAPDADYSAAAVGADLLAVVDAFGLDRVALVGHDWGAELGYHLVAAHPERFSTFVALGVPHPSGYAIRHHRLQEMRTAWYAIFLGYVTGAAETARDATWLTALVQSWSPGMRWSAWDDVLDALRRPGVLEAVCAYYRSNMDASATHPTIHVPTTIIHGGQDGCITPNAHPDFSEFFPGGIDQVLLREVGHWPHLEAAERTLDITASALAAVAPW